MASSAATVPQKEAPRYTVGEEVANAVSHGVGCALSVTALVLLIVRAVQHGGGAHLAAALFMGVTLIVAYLDSTLYHAIQPRGAKAVFRILDHADIYLLIAGSYAPFALITLADHDGARFFAIVCAIGIAGAISEAFLRERQPAWLGTLLYLAMGWIAILRVQELYMLLPTGAFRLLLAGGLCYTAGTPFFLMKDVRYMHFVFHLFVLAGSVCITLAALIYVV